MKIKFVKSHANAVVPKQVDGNNGWDIYAVEDGRIYAGTVGKIATGLKLAENIPTATARTPDVELVPFLKIEGRSGMASKGVFPVGGIVDQSYRGEIMVALFNSTPNVYEYKAGDRIAQFVCYLTYSNLGDNVVEMIEVDEQSETDRGEKGFGSSGR